MEDKQWYITVGGERIAVSEDEYRAYKRPLWAERKRRERESKCRDGRGVRCNMDCALCDGSRSGRPLSLERLAEDGIDVADPEGVEELFLNEELRQALRRAVAGLPEDERRIIGIAFQGKPEREAAAEAGMPRTTFVRRRDRIIAKLRKILCG